jgi:dTDP-4-amino-4,6-dideoxygalactose transaminase
MSIRTTIGVGLVAEEFGRRVRSGEPLPAAIIPVDLYGRCADLGPVADLLAEHVEVGFNHRLSNVRATPGSSQLSTFERDVAAFDGIAGVGVADPLQQHDGLRGDLPSRWPTCIALDPSVHGVARDLLIDALVAGNIATRPVWRPMHL